jgi:hypothetical protein
MKIHPVGAELFHADGKTDKTKLTVAFRNFANVPKNRKKDKQQCGGECASLKSIENCKQLNTNTYISKKQKQEEYSKIIHHLFKTQILPSGEEV